MLNEEILISPIITEKSSMLQESNKYVFKVHKNSNKIQIKQAIEEVFDVTGAGDTVVSVLAMALAGKFNCVDAAKLSNMAASIVVGKIGTAVVTLPEINEYLEEEILRTSKAVLNLEELTKTVSLAKSVGKIVVFTNGCFDLIHQGHLEYLKKAKSKCDFLVLGVNTDASVKKIKGHKRPILNLSERVGILASFNFVDMIISFNDETPIKLIKKIRPEIIFKGSDYKLKEVVGHKEVSSWGGKVELVKYLKGKSTSNILKRIKENET